MAQLTEAAAAILATAPPLPLTSDQWRAVAGELGLSDQEANVVELALRDLCNKQIATVLGISKKTVEEYLS
jgi:FixJ family two-component response regulator